MKPYTTNPVLTKVLSYRFLLLLLFVLISSHLAKAQCPPGNMTLRTQEDVNTFRASFPNCTEVPGSLIISGSDITDLSPLASLTSIGEALSIDDNAALTSLDGLTQVSSIGGDLWIGRNTTLTDIEGLSSLTSIGGNLTFKGNTALTNLDGLNALSSLGSNLYLLDNSALIDVDGLISLSAIDGGLVRIFDNAKLTNLDGLSSLTSVDGSLAIQNNASLTQVDGLSLLSTVGGNLILRNNASLTNLDGLSALSHIGGNLVISENTALTDISQMTTLSTIDGSFYLLDNAALTHIDGLGALSSIGERLEIFNNAALTDIDGLSSLTSIGGLLEISHNSALTNIDGLVNIEPTTISFLELDSNPKLSACKLQNVCDYLSLSANNANISGNASGCDDRAEIIASCRNRPPVNITIGTQADVQIYQKIKSGNNTADINIHPNPATTKSFIELNNLAGLTGTVHVFDQMGKVIYSRSYEQLPDTALSLDVLNYKGGVYFVSVMAEGNNRITKRLVVVN